MTGNKVLAVAGGGAAGFFGAINAAALCPELKVIILEKTHKLLSKVRVSGGGRCNVTHACYDNKLLSENYPRGRRELRSVLQNFGPQQMTEWFAQRNIKLKTEEDGRMFPSTNTSETIIQCYLSEAEKYNVEIRTGVGISSFEKHDKFVLSLTDKTTLTCDYLLITTGGSAAPKNYEWITQSCSHKIIAPLPSLFTFNIPDSPLKGLEGVSVTHAKVSLSGIKQIATGPVLITHWGVSGPAVIRLSALAARELFELGYNCVVRINFFPEENAETLKQKFISERTHSPQLTVQQLLHSLPQRLRQRICDLVNIKLHNSLGNVSNSQINVLANKLTSFELLMKGKTTFKEEFVTSGGVSLKEVNMQNMESKLVNNLFFAGEVLDIDGITGGFNFQAAWSTAMAAAQTIAIRCSKKL